MQATSIEIRTLQNVPFDDIHRAFSAAFSDYLFPLHATPEQLLEMFTRRGWDPALSPGAFAGDDLIGFVINALDGDVGYNSGTGVAPDARRSHVGLELMERSYELLRARGAKRYVLEVIRENHRAAALYLRLGFTNVRVLQCWLYDGPAALECARIENPDWDSLRAMWDVTPSWQNSIRSLQRSTLDHVVIGDERGYAVVLPSTGDLPQLAVAREHRRQGLGRALLRSAAAIAEKPLRLVNVDASEDGISSFLEAVGAQKTIAQNEMIATL